MSGCKECHGTGKVTCSKCGGTGEGECGACKGTGIAICVKCGGEGYYEECYLCGGTGWGACTKCSGSGQLFSERRKTCTRCAGIGRYAESSGYVHVCDRCGGAGYIVVTDIWKCNRCNGRGRVPSERCLMCNGKGKLKCSKCNGTGKKGSGHERCSSCNGTGKGKCDKCGGSGSQNCPECERREEEAVARRKEAIKRAKERKDAVMGCGCLLAIVAVVGFFIWWWLEGMTMAALSGMWEQTKNALGEDGMKAMATIGGGIVALLVVWRLIKGIKGKEGEVSTSPKKRWKFVVLGIVLGFFGIHLAYAKRWLLFLLLWAGFITGNVMAPAKSDSGEKPAEATARQVEPMDNAKKHGGRPIGGIGFAVWGLLWIGGTLFIKKDGKGKRM